MKENLISVKKKLSVTFGLSIIVTCIVFCGLGYLGIDFLNYYLEGNSFLIYNEEKPYIEKFQKFVSENHLSTLDIQAYDQWMDEQGVSFYSIEQDGKVIYNKSNVDKFISAAKNMYDYRKTGSYKVPVKFADTEAEVFIYAGFTEKYYTAFMIFDVGFSICMGMFFVFMRIRKIISNYQFELEKSREQEKNVREEKDELMRNMAHDLRTPLTGVMTYIDVMKLENKSNLQNMEYLDLLGDKVMNIREQIDNMFDFSIASSEKPIELDSSMAVEYTIGDYLSDMYTELVNSGYEVNANEVRWKNVKAAINIGLLSRVFTNLTDNIYKYADKSKAVVLKISYNKDSVEVEISNGICDDKTLREGTGIGLKSVEMMMKKMNGSMSYSRDDEMFRVKLKFPFEE